MMDRYAMRASRRRFEHAIRRDDCRQSVVPESVLLELYACMTAEQIAKKLDAKVSTIRSRISRARRGVSREARRS